MKALLNAVLRRAIRVGTLRVQWPDGEISRFGDGAPEAGFSVASWATVRRIALNPQLGFPEAYMDGGVRMLACDIYHVMDVLQRNLGQGHDHPLMAAQNRLRRALNPILQFNPVARSRQNVAHHYDLDGRLYGLLLDADRQYSCAYFRTGQESLDDAQAAKKQHIAAKLLLNRPGLSVLDIGCGWGGMALTLARDHGAVVTGITLSEEQHAYATRRAAEAGLADRVRFVLRDYRDEAGRYDRIVSVGMFEHVGRDFYPQFFAAVRRCLAPGGVALLHMIGRSDGPGATPPFIRKYIFPGGYVPALSEVMPALEASGLCMTDLEVLRLHYARTIAHWRARFAARRDDIEALYDARFCRMFELYLAGAELAFRHQHQVNFQIQLAHAQEDAPLTRDYQLAVARAAMPLAAAGVAP